MRDPIYHQLNDRLRELVSAGEFGAGAKFLTEREVSARFGVSRVTANKALGSLVTEGLLEFRKGVGTFVRQGALDTDLRSLVSFTHRARKLGHRPATRVVRFERMLAGELEGVAAALRLQASDEVFVVERLRLADETPVIYERRQIAAKVCPGLTAKMLGTSFYTLLTQRYELRMTGADQVIRAVNLGKAEARALGVVVGAAALWLHAVGWAGEQPVWVEDTFYRGDRYEFHNHLGRRQAASPARVQLRGKE